MDPAGISRQNESENDAVHAVEAIQTRVKRAMQKYASIIRTEAGLKQCQKILNNSEVHLNALKFMGLSNFKQFYHARNMILTAYLIVDSARRRKKSMGPHCRTDAPSFPKFMTGDVDV